MPRRFLVYLWALPTSLPGLALAAFSVVTGGRARVVAGVLEVEGALVRRLLAAIALVPGGALALTLGHVVLGRHARALAETRAHERVHVAQAERWGPLFLPAYLVASACSAWRGEGWYEGNRFEREARCAEDGPR